MAFRRTLTTLAPTILRASSSSARLSPSVVAPIRASIPSLRFTPTTSTAILNPNANANQHRSFASGGGLSHEQIQERINDVLKSFEKVNPSKLSPTASFTSDLGLDSLDAVEVVMAIEEEFSIEIPDAEADNITTVQQAIDYISKTPEAI